MVAVRRQLGGGVAAAAAWRRWWDSVGTAAWQHSGSSGGLGIAWWLCNGVGLGAARWQLQRRQRVGGSGDSAAGAAAALWRLHARMR